MPDDTWNGDPSKPLIIDLKRKSDDQMRITLARGSVDRKESCNCCKVLTNRVDVAQLSSDGVPRVFHRCDDCALNLSKLICKEAGLLRRGL